MIEATLRFDFATASQILFGVGRIRETGQIGARLGKRALVVGGRNVERLNPIIEVLSGHQIYVACFQVVGEPTVDIVLQGLDKARQEKCDLIVGCGGGSALDTGKAIAALLTNPGDIFDYLEVVGKGKPLTEPSAPFIAIPTTAGTGSEVTRNAVLGVPNRGVKVSLRSHLMLPRVAIVDPSLTYSLPPEVTARSGLDALTQLIEPYVSNQPNPLVDPLCQEGLRRISLSLRRAYMQGDDMQARQDMSFAALLSGMALANARLGAVHGFAGPLGGKLGAPHGAICARLLPVVMAVNLKALKKRAPESEILTRYVKVAQILTGDPDATAEEGIAWVERLCSDLKIAPLSTYGLSPVDFPEMVEKASQASSMKGNPIPLTQEEMYQILESAV